MYLNSMMPDLSSLATLIGKLLTDDSFSREQTMSDEAQYEARQKLLGAILPSITVSFAFSTDDLGTPFKVTPIMRRIAEILEPVLSGEHFLNIRLALEEVVSNIIEHSYGEDVSGVEGSLAQQGKIVFRFTITSEDIAIDVEDFGERGKNYSLNGVGDYKTLTELRDKNQGKMRGLGVFLVRKIMDEVRYEVVPGEYNRISMKKRLV
ncbi:MAG: ATP-binding protein [Candidatus Kapaibacteriota bacterium]